MKRTPDNKPLSCLICISWQSDKSMFIWHQSLGQPGVNCLGWINNDGLVSELQSFLTWLFVMENVIGILWRDQGQEWWIRHLTTVPDLSIPDFWIRIKHFQSLWLTGGHSLPWYSWIFIHLRCLVSMSSAPGLTLFVICDWGRICVIPDWHPLDLFRLHRPMEGSNSKHATTTTLQHHRATTCNNLSM